MLLSPFRVPASHLTLSGADGLNDVRDSRIMPFPDEPSAQTVQVFDYRPEWASEGVSLVAALGDLFPEATAIDHIGSTSIPGMPAKDCIDAMVRVRSLELTDLGPVLAAGYRERPEEWNRIETLGLATYPKRVFAPPVGGRSVNINIREATSRTARYALLFRDFLRADPDSRDQWGRFKLRMAQEDLDIYAYGQLKATVQPLLMALAERWATQTRWHTWEAGLPA